MLKRLTVWGGVGLVMAAMFLGGVFESWQGRLSDALFLPRKASSEITIIAIDDKSIQAIGRWPWERGVYARLIEKLDGNPAAIGLDVAFPEGSREDGELALVLERVNNVVLPIEAGELKMAGGEMTARDLLWPIPLFRERAKTGLVNVIADADGIVRRAIVRARTGESEESGFGVEVLALMLEARDSKFEMEELVQIPIDQGAMRINFAGKPGTFKTYSFVDVLDGKVGALAFKDKIVLVGATASDLHDSQMTPVSGGKEMSGVEIHANVIQTILERKFLIPQGRGSVLLMVFIMGGVVALLSNLRMMYLTIGVMGIVVAYVIYAVLRFDRGTIVNLVYPVASCLITYIAMVIYKYVTESRQKRFIRKALSYYLSEPVMRDVLQNPKKLSLGGQRREISVLFSDIAGFTSISEKLEPEALASLLNQYLTRMTRIVFKHNGVLDKYIGDAVMAFWGAPIEVKNHALLACRTALEMQEEIVQVQKEWLEMGISGFAVRIGINTGEMVVGNMGSDLRFDYTLLGDNVNLGSRLEGINKEYWTKIIISDSTYSQVKDEVIARKIDVVAVKGKEKGVAIYELMGLGKANIDQQKLISQFEQARELYEAGKFRDAVRQFRKLQVEYPGDGPIATYVNRCEDLIRTPLKNWDGVYHAKSK